MSSSRRTLRRSQALNPFGPGAIYDVLGESFVGADTSRWPATANVIAMDRLAMDLQVRDFRSPPPAPDDRWRKHGPGVPFQRFPRWLFCQRCRQMQRWNSGRERELEGARPNCGRCKGHPSLVPVRFVAICVDGHLDDVDWPFWAHSANTAPGVCRSLNLEFLTDPTRGGGLDSLSVRCRECKRGRTLGDLVIKDALKRVGVRCRGLQPWLQLERAEQCGQTPQVVQRGASNVHFPDLRSALDIPPWSNFDPLSEQVTKLRTDSTFVALVQQLNASEGVVNAAIGVFAEILSKAHDMPQEDILGFAQGEREGSDRAVVHVEGDLIDQEWRAFAEPTGTGHPMDRFVTRAVAFNPDDEPRHRGLNSLIETVIVADKLREVRALAGFSRLEPGVRVVRPDLGRGLKWLPALEIYGEGIFLRFSEARLKAWEGRADVRERVGNMERNRANSRLTTVLSEPASPRLVLLHTLAHLLIRQLSYECGYSSASLRERLYARPSDSRPMSGILIYTASGDSEGTLGGLARQGEPSRLPNTILAALSRSVWCSTDPICVESAGQGMGALNRGACHACALLAETSCTHLNSLLDRGLVVGTPEAPSLGFFSDVVEQVLTTSGDKA